MCVEFELNGIAYERQVPIPVSYKGHNIGEYRLDILVETAIILELKSVDRYGPIFEAQLLSYLKLTGKHVGLLINFNRGLLKDGIKRIML